VTNRTRAMKRAMASATRVECKKESNGFGGKSDGDKGGPPCLGDVGLCLSPAYHPIVFKILVNCCRHCSPPCSLIRPRCSLPHHHRHIPANRAFLPPPLLPRDQGETPLLPSSAWPPPCCVLKAMCSLR
jgi:hypothetical protein